MASTKSFFSLLAGLAAGAAIGILYAPDKGWKTRARVKKATANGYEDLNSAPRLTKRRKRPGNPSRTSVKPSARRAAKSRKVPATCSSSSSNGWKKP